MHFFLLLFGLRLTLPTFLLLLLVSLLGLLLLQGLLLHFELLLQLVLSLPLFIPFLLFQQRVANLFGQIEVDCVVFDKSGKRFPAVVNLAQLNEEGDEVVQLSVLGVVIPRDDGHGALRLQHVSRGRIVEDNRILHVSPNLAHVLRKHPVDVGAVLSEESHCAIPIWVHQIHKRVRILTQTRRENDQLEVLAHGLQEVVNTWSFAHENVAHVPLNVHWNSVIRIFDLVEL